MTLLQHNDLSKPLRSFGHAMQARTTMISEPEANSVAVIISGGLDSTVAATIACERYKHVHLLHFLYGARAQNREIKAVEDVAAHLRRRFHDQCEVFEEYIDLSYLQTLGGSTLTEHDREIALGEIGVETAHEWVPARNLVMAAMAAAYCDRHDIGSIMLGTNREESAVYADNSSEFHRALSKTLALCTQARPRIVAPLENMMKAHIYAAALKHGAPINLSWSCYQSGEQTNGLHCGVCGPCQLRRVAAQMNDAFDCIIYHTSCDPCDSTPTDVRIVLG
jgi:7-cyano-7-deazaguanine synthase